MNLLDVPFYHQSNEFMCAPAAAQGILAFYGINKSEAELTEAMQTMTNKGTPPLFFVKCIEKSGLKARFIHKLKKEKAFALLQTYLQNNIPIIVSLNMNTYRKYVDKVKHRVSWQGKNFTFHYVVVTGFDETYIYFNDSAEKTAKSGRMKLSINMFLSAWYNQYLSGDMFIIKK